MMSQQGSQSNANPNKPRAFINVIFFDEQFKAVDFRTSMVGSNSTLKDHYAELQNLIAGKSGYVYIYCSNESPVDVFFDNIQVVHTRSVILEENSYYPFGLAMAGISSKAAGSLENKKKYNGIEFDNDLDINTYEAYYRNLDPQTGRWWEIDPEIENGMEDVSPYTSMYNDPVLKSDFLGNVPEDCHCCPEAVAIIQSSENIAAQWGPYARPVIVGGLVAAAAVAVGELIKENPEIGSGQLVVNNSFAWDPTYANSLRSSSVVASPAAYTGAYGDGQTLFPNTGSPFSTLVGTQNPKVKESIKVGQEAHRQEQAKLKKEGAKTEVPMRLKDGTNIRKDAVKKDGTPVIIKPDTKSGKASAARREKLLDRNGVKKPDKIFYNPKDPKYQPGSPTYIGPKL
jgi:RHS repeat-associated protein